MVRKKASMWFGIGAHPQTLFQIFGGVENGRLRGLPVWIDSAHVHGIPFFEKLAEHGPSLKVLQESHTILVLNQQKDSPVIKKPKCSPESVTVQNVLHEAARDVCAQLDNKRFVSTLACPHAAQAMRPAITKFVGKLSLSLAMANMFQRNCIYGRWTKTARSPQMESFVGKTVWQA